MKAIALIITTLLFSFNIHAQDRLKYYPTLHTIPIAGYLWQGINTYEFGVRILPLRNNNLQTLTLLANGIFFNHNSTTYFAPELTIKHGHPVNKSLLNGHILWTIACSYWTFKMGAHRQNKLTPELGLSFGIISIAYGYNIPISSPESSPISKHRISLRIFDF